MEFDWSDKKEADELDTKCAILRNEDTNKQFYPGAARFQEMYAFLICSRSGLAVTYLTEVCEVLGSNTTVGTGKLCL